MTHKPLIVEDKDGNRKPHKDAVPFWKKDPRTVKSEFKGDFTAYQVGDMYYFLTEDGRLFSLSTDAKKEKMEAVWNEAKQPIIGCIQDVTNKTVYAVGRKGDGTQDRFWFELSPKPKVKEFQRTKESIKADPRRGEVLDAWKEIRASRPKPVPKAIEIPKK